MSIVACIELGSIRRRRRGVVGAAVIVLGSRGLTGVRELVEGSLSHEVAEHARRPVLVVPPNEPPLP